MLTNQEAEGVQMDGQWLGTIDGDIGGTLRIDLEDRGQFFQGNAYLFYEPQHRLPGFMFQLQIPKSPPHKTSTETLYLYANGGLMTLEERLRRENDIEQRFNTKMPAVFHLELTHSDNVLTLAWSSLETEISDTIYLTGSDLTAGSDLAPDDNLISWENFREWAVDQQPRRYIFRGQSKPYKLTSSFHRTWRKDLRSWIDQDVTALFGSVIERVNYPLRLGELSHNAAIWSILQHHGYPTPLLDWSFSPFVAAYFAFYDHSSVGDAAPRLYIFDQTAWTNRYGMKEFVAEPAPPRLVVMESLAIGNPRSGPQQALSIVTNIADVEAFIRQREQADGEKYLMVCDLPADERPKIIRELELMGITYGSLFPGLDGICRDMYARNFARPT